MLRRQSILSSSTIWLVGFALLFFAAETQPVPGVILMAFGEPLLNIGLIYLIPGAFVLDCLIGPFHPAGLAVPILVVAGLGLWYEGERHKDQAAVPAIEAELQSRDTGTTFPFDPARQALVYPNYYKLLPYQLPAIYDSNESEHAHSRLVRYGIKPRRQCPTGASTPGISQTVVVDLDSNSWCLTHTELDPYLPLVSVDTQEQPKETIDGHEVSLYRTVATYNGVPVAHLVQASVNLLAAFPTPLFGCGLVDNPSAWTCFFYWGRQRTELDTLPGPQTSQNTDALGLLLGLKPRSQAEIADLTAR